MQRRTGDYVAGSLAGNVITIGTMMRAKQRDDHRAPEL